MRLFVIEPEGTPDFPGLMLATLRALRSLGGSARIAELDEAVAEAEGVSEAEQAHMMPNGAQPRYNYYLAWARTYLKKVGMIENSRRAVWTITDQGEGVDDLASCQAAHETVLGEIRARQKRKREEAPAEFGAKDTAVGDPEDPAEIVDDWEQVLLNAVGVMTPDGAVARSV